MIVRALIVSTAFAATALCAGGAGATNLLTNGSFEAPNLGSGGYTYPGGTLDSWYYGGSALVNAQGGSAWYGASPPAGVDGLQFAALQSASNLSQGFTTAHAGAVTVTWADAGRPDFGGYAGRQHYTFNFDGSAVAFYQTTSGSAFGPESLTFTHVAAGAHVLTFQGLVNNSDQTAFIDNVSASLVASAPEPAAWALMLVGFAGLGGALRASRRGLRAA